MVSPTKIFKLKFYIHLSYFSCLKTKQNFILNSSIQRPITSTLWNSLISYALRALIRRIKCVKDRQIIFTITLIAIRSETFRIYFISLFNIEFQPEIICFFNPSAWGHLNPSSYCDVGRLFYGVFKLWSKLQRKK